MDAQSTQLWRRAASDMVGRFSTDRHNARILRDPWSRAAHSMVNGWRIRLSRPPAKGNAPVAARPTWREFARRGVGILASKRHYATKSNWRRWAQNRTTAGTRYIPKRLRTW